MHIILQLNYVVKEKMHFYTRKKGKNAFLMVILNQVVVFALEKQVSSPILASVLYTG